MATQVGGVSIEIEARLAKFESDIGRAARLLEREMTRSALQTERAISRMQKRVTEELERINNFFGQIGGRFAALFSVAVATQFARKLADTADQFSNIQAKVRLAAGENANLARSMQAVFDVSQRTFNSFDATAKLVGKTAMALRDAGMSYAQSFDVGLRLAEVFNKSLVVSGASAQEAAASTQQFAQALASGKFQGDEFRSVMENNSRFASLLATSLGTTTAGLRAMSTEGKLNLQTMLGVLNNTKALDEQFAKMPLTIGRAKTLLDNAWTKYIGESDQAAGTSRSVANAIKTLADNLPAVVSAIVKLTEVTVAYFAIFRVAPALWNAATASLAAYRIEVGAIAVAQEMGMVAATNWQTTLVKGASVVMAAFVGFQIGTYLSDQFVEVRLAGITMVEALLIGAERVKAGFQAIGLAIGMMVAQTREEFAQLIDFEARMTDFIPSLRVLGVGDEMKQFAADLRSGGDSVEAYAVKIAVLGANLKLTEEGIRKTTSEMADAELHTKGNADANVKLAGAVTQTLDTLVVQGKALDKSSGAANSYQTAMNKLADLASKAAGEMGPLAKIEADHAEHLRDIAQAGGQAVESSRKLGEAKQREGAIHAAVQAAITGENAAYAKLLAEQKKQLDISGPIIRDLKERQKLIGLTDSQKAAASAVNSLRDAYERLDPEQQKQITNLDAMSAEVAQLAMETAEAEKAAEFWKSTWEGAVNDVSRAIGEFAVGNIRTWKDFSRQIVGTFKNMVSQIISEWARTKLIGMFTGSGGGGGGFWGSLFGMGAAALAGSGSSPGVGSVNPATGMTVTGTSPTGGFQYGGGANAGGFSFGNVTNYGTMLTGNGQFSGAIAANPGAVGTTMAWGGAIAGAYYGSQQGGTTRQTAMSTAAGAIAGYYAGTVAAGALIGGASAAAVGAGTAGAATGAMGAAAAVPVIGWIALIALVVDYFSGGKVFGTKFRPEEHRFTAGFSQSGITATSQLDEWKYVGGAGSFGRGQLLTGGWGEKDRRTRNLPIDPEVIAALQKILTDINKTYASAAQALGTSVVPMLDATFETITTYTEKGKVKATKTIGTILGKMYEEPMEDFVKRMHAEGIIATLDQVAKGASAVAEAYRGSADALLDAASTMLQIQVDLQKGKGLLGGGGTLASSIAWVDSLRVGEEKLIDTYMRLAQATAQYNDILDRADEAMHELTRDKGPVGEMAEALADINAQMTDNIEALNAAAVAAGLSAAKEKDLARIRELAAAQIDKITTDFYAGIDAQIDALTHVSTPSGDFRDAMRGIAQQFADNIDQANLLARAAGQQAASEANLARIHELAARQAAAAIRQLVSIGQAQARSLYGGAHSLADVDSDIAALESRLSSASSTMGEFGNAVEDAASKASEAIKLLIGDLSPLNDTKKLQVALGGLQQGVVTPEEVLTIGRRLYASSSAYNALFEQVLRMTPHGGSEAAGQPSSGTSGLTTEEQARLAALYEQREVMRAEQRLREARDLAETVATLADAQGRSFEEIADQLGFNMEDLADDLSLSYKGLVDYLNAIDTQANRVPDSITSNIDRLIAAITELWGTNGGPTTVTTEAHKSSLASNSEITQELRAIGAVTNQARRESGDQMTRQTDAIERLLYEIAINRNINAPRSLREPGLNVP